MKYPFPRPDLTKPLVPEHLPWLAHTAFWPRFTDAERLRANQLMGLLVNELCLAVEHGLILGGLRNALGSAAIRSHAEIRQRFLTMLADEERHARWFTFYNQTFAPELYAKNGMHFISPPRALLGLAKLLAAFPGAWRFTVWLVMATEEWSCRLADALRAETCGESAVDPGFQKLHAAHRRDELRHIVLDQHLIELAGRGLNPVLRRSILALAHVGIDQLMRPRRAAPAMLRQFVCEFPRWRRELPAMVDAVGQVGANPRYWRDQGISGDLAATTRSAAEWGFDWYGLANA